MKRSLLLAAIVVFSGLYVGPVTAQEDTATLTVSVVTQSDAPVRGAELTAEWEGGSTTATTASNGKAFIDVPSGANVTVDVSHPDYVRNSPVEVVDATDREVTVDVFRKGTLRVQVTDARGTVEDARVVVRKGGSVVAVGDTTSAGVLRTGDIEAGDYTVAVLKAGYLRNITAVNVNGSTARDVVIERGSVSLTFNVTDPHFSPPEPVGEARIEVETVGTFNTLDSGDQTVSVPVNTDLTVVVSKDAYETVERTVEVGERTETVNVSLSRTPLVNLTPVNTQVVVGERVAVRVTDEYGTPIEGARVSLDGEQAARTGADGGAAVRLETAGNHTIRASSGDLASEPVRVQAVEAGGSTATPTGTPTATPTSTPEPTTTPTSFPGFTPVLAVLALVLAALLARRRA